MSEKSNKCALGTVCKFVWVAVHGQHHSVFSMFMFEMSDRTENITERQNATLPLFGQYGLYLSFSVCFFNFGP